MTAIPPVLMPRRVLSPLRILCAVLLLGASAAGASGGEEADNDSAPVVFAWKAKDGPKRLERPGAYIWYVPELLFPPGTYHVTGRLQGDGAAAFTLQARDQATDRERWRSQVVPPPEPAEVDFGEFDYAGDYPLRISDYNAPGFALESVAFTLVKPLPFAVSDRDDAERLDGWIALQKTALAVDPEIKRQGEASLKVTVSGDANAQWYDLGAARRLAKDEVRMISFWLRFDTPPRRLWVRLQHKDGGLAKPVPVSESVAEAGKWVFLELPVSTFAAHPTLPMLRQVYSAAFTVDPGADDCVFHLDDILLE